MNWLTFILHVLGTTCVTALDGDKMKELGWVPAKSVRERIAEVTQWTLNNERWITL